MPTSRVYLEGRITELGTKKLAMDSVLELALVLRAVEMAFGFCDESVIVDRPKFVAADANAFSCAAGSGVGSRQRPMELRSLFVVLELVHRHDHVRKCSHERLRFLGNRRSSNRRRPVVNAD